jgi:hypothetical protein
VVARDHDDRHAQVQREPSDGAVQQPDGVRRRNGAVEDVAGDDHGVSLYCLDQSQQPAQGERLVLREAAVVEETAQVPVCRVDEAHGLCPRGSLEVKTHASVRGGHEPDARGRLLLGGV